jgi:hypothetical protein
MLLAESSQFIFARKGNCGIDKALSKELLASN